MDPYNFESEVNEEEGSYIHEPDLETCPVCWWASRHVPGCPAEIEVSIEALEPELQAMFA